MSTLLERGLKMLSRSTPGVAGGRIIYQRGTDQIWMEATFGRSEFNVETTEAVWIESSDRDFIVDAESLILGGKRATPQRGDRITVVEEEHGDRQVFEVLAPAGAQVYRLCDPQGNLIRIHTKRLTT